MLAIATRATNPEKCLRRILGATPTVECFPILELLSASRSDRLTLLRIMGRTGPRQEPSCYPLQSPKSNSNRCTNPNATFFSRQIKSCYRSLSQEPTGRDDARK